MADTIVRSAATSIAERVGEDPSRIRIQDPQWARFAQEGLIVELHVGRWRAKIGVTMADLGIVTETREEARAIERLISLGTRYLLPRRIIAQCENLDSKARYALEKYSFKTFWGRWLHVSRYALWRADSDLIQSDYFDLARTIYEQWDALMDEVRRDYLILGQQTYQRLALGRPGFTPLSREQWIAEFVARCMAQIPTREAVRDSFTYDFDASFVPTQEQVQADFAAARSQEVIDRERARIEAVSLMEQDYLRTSARKAAEGMQRFATDLQAQIREAVYDVAVDALEQWGKNGGKLPKNTVRGLKNLIETTQSMVFWDDPELEVRVRSLEAVIATPSDKRDPKDVRNALQRLGAEARMTLLDLKRAPARSGKGVGIPDEQGEKLERVSRRGAKKLEVGTLKVDLDGRVSRTAREEFELQGVAL